MTNISDSIVISIKNLTKIYKLYNNPKDRLKEALNVSRKKYHKEFYALNNVSFDINKGETVGIIGKNGSGKSTLLKILTGVLSPTSGDVVINGKVAALLELGAGFNPEFTGMENIFLQGTLLGFTKEQMEKKVDDIIKFADIGESIYQPVKMYSSGMFVRLAFAVQACIEPEILIVDEALAVGDAKFSSKCIDYMKELVKKGTTVIFVTHDVNLVRSFCNKVIWINHGEKVAEGESREVTSLYMENLFDEDSNKSNNTNSIELNEDNNKIDSFEEEEIYDFNVNRWGNGAIMYQNCMLYNEQGIEKNTFNIGEEIRVKVTFKANEDIHSENVGLGFSFRNRNGLDIIVYTTIEDSYTFGPMRKNESIIVEFKLTNILAPGEYLLTLQIEDRQGYSTPKYYDFVEDAKIFKVFSDAPVYSLVKPKVDFNIVKRRPTTNVK